MSTLITYSTSAHLGSQRFERFSIWSSLTRAIANLVRIAHALHRTWVTTNSECTGWYYCRKSRTSEKKISTIRAVQEETYAEELSHIRNNNVLSKSKPLKKLCHRRAPHRTVACEVLPQGTSRTPLDKSWR